LVNAEGEQIRVDADHEPELFWAMRGGGGNFGIVTALELELTPLEAVYAGAFFFDYARSSEVLRAWREWIEDKPEELLSIGRMLKFPPLPEVPEPMRGNSFGVIEAVYMGDEAEGAELIKRCATWGPPWTPSLRCRRPGSSSCTWTRPSRCPTTPSTCS
jgi:FAD/FMN-containing dehydrogenase